MSGLLLGDLTRLTDIDTLCANVQGKSIVAPSKVTGRVAHIDGDYLAYIVSADRKDKPATTMAKALKHLDEFIKQLCKYSGSTDYVIHLTSGEKGGRAKQALLKPYQQNRDGKEVPLLLYDVRRHISESEKSYVCTDGEADDSMAMELYNARLRGEEELAVLISQDKDLRMVQGWQLDWMSNELYYVDALGKLECHETVKYKDGKKKVTKKVKGTGGMWFFCQLLQGDTADNISGLPKMAGFILNEIKPTKPITKAKETITNPKSTELKVTKAKKLLAERKGGNCGQMIAYNYLKDCKTLKEAYQRVFIAFTAYDLQYGFHDYDGNKITTMDAFESECRLLYMRHTLDSEDFREYINWIMEGKLDD